MSPRRLTMTLCLAATLAIACSSSNEKKNDNDKTPSKSASGSASAKVDGEGQFPGWDLAARKKAWNGAWVLEGAGLGMWEAWEVKDGAVTIWDGKTEHKETLDFTSPCTVGVSGPTGGYESHYTVTKDGKLMTGLGDAGSRRGSETIVCISNTIMTIGADGKCQKWYGFGRKLTPEPAKCSLVKEGDNEFFSAELFGSTTKVPVHDDAIYSDAMKDKHAEPAADFAAAKAARDKKAAR